MNVETNPSGVQSTPVSPDETTTLVNLGRKLFFIYAASIAIVIILVNFVPHGEYLLEPIPDDLARFYFLGLPLVIGIVGLMLGIKKKRPGMGVLALVLTPIGIWIAIMAKAKPD